MPRMRYFNSPLMLGFDDLEETLERVSKMTAEGYPPYNIEQMDDSSTRITLAVAGFRDSDLVIERKGAQLTIKGRQSDDNDNKQFLHRGIAARQFQRSFLLAESMRIQSATLSNGLLHIDIDHPTPEDIVETIPITTPDD
ncbi:MAG: Hsp20 family protein [Alphaproteobacteria bacterium]